jgi:hypothetical protein
MEFEVRVLKRAADAKEDEWDRCSGGLSFNDHQWYEFGEASRQGDTPIHILLFHQGEPAARASFWLTWQEPIPIASKWLRDALGQMLQRRPLLVCRTPVADASGLCLPTDPTLRPQALEVIARTSLKLAAQYKASFVLFPYLLHDQAREAGWPASFTAVDLPGPATRLMIRWTDFESYLKQLPRSTRNYFRHNRNRAKDLDLRVEAGKEPVSSEEAMRFIRNVEDEHGSPHNPWAASIIQNAGLADSTWFIASTGARMAGCLLTFQDGENGLLSLIGLDYGIPYAYFQLLYEAIGYAIGKGVKTLWGGTGAYQFKQSLGFELVDNTWAVFAGRRKVLQFLGRMAARWAL